MDFQLIWLISYRQYRMPLQELLLSERKLTISLLFYASFTGYQFNIELFFKILLLVYKALNGLAPAYISERLQYRISSRLLCSAWQRLLSIPRTSPWRHMMTELFRLLAPNCGTNYLYHSDHQTFWLFSKRTWRVVYLNLPIVSNLHFNHDFLFNYYHISF